MKAYRTEGGKTISVLLVDEQSAVRQGLRIWLTTEPDVTVVGEAGSGEEAIRLAQTLSPDVVLMDVAMPGMDGLATTAAFRANRPDSAVVMLSLHDDDATRAQAKAAGACAFVGKHEAADTLLTVIRRAAGQFGHAGAELAS